MWASLIVFAESSAEVSSRDCRSSYQHVFKQKANGGRKCPSTFSAFWTHILQFYSPKTISKPPSFKLSSDVANTSPTFHSTCRSFTGASLVLCNRHPTIHPADHFIWWCYREANLLWNPRQTERKKRFFQWKPAFEERQVTGWKSRKRSLTVASEVSGFSAQKIAWHSSVGMLLLWVMGP